MKKVKRMSEHKENLMYKTSLNDETEILKIVAEKIKREGFSSRNYEKEKPILQASKPLPGNIYKNYLLQKNLTYLYNLYLSLENEDSYLKNKMVIEEARYYDEKGILCVYFSVILYCLLLKDKLATKDELKLMIGYIHYHTHNLFYNELLNIQEITGFHSWLTYQGSVLDVSIIQEHTTFDFTNGYIVGQIPDGLEMYGIGEGWATVERYARKFARRMGLKVKQWIQYHTIISFETFRNYLESIQEGS